MEQIGREVWFSSDSEFEPEVQVHHITSRASVRYI